MPRNLRPYPKYKDSGVEWLGKVPEYWKVMRLRFIAKTNPSKTEIAKLDRNTEVSFFPMEAIGDDGSLNLERTRPIGEVETGYTYFREGDVTIAKITPCFENGKGAIMHGLLGGIGFGTTELIVVRPKTGKTTNQYLHLILVSPSFRKLGEAEMYGAGGQKRVPDDFVQNFPVALPPFEEQLAISSFLDRETAKIDSLIAKQNRLIELLQEKRSALISHAVTKGLDPTVKMKDSGVEWLGEVPEGWKVKRLKHLSKIQTGDKDTVNAVDGGTYPFFVRSQSVEKIDSFTFDCEAILTAGDGVGVGKVFHHYSGPFDFHQRVYMLNKFQNVIGRFLFYFLKEQFYRVALDGNSKSTVDSLRMPLFLNFPIALPPIEEQLAISSFLDQETSRIDTLTSEAKKFITLLQEYRSSLITAAVTGKIDVREVVPSGSGKRP